jgi:hypothetical protein
MIAGVIADAARRNGRLRQSEYYMRPRVSTSAGKRLLKPAALSRRLALWPVPELSTGTGY